MGYGAIASALIDRNTPKGYFQPTLDIEGHSFPIMTVETQIRESAQVNLGIVATHTVIDGQGTIF